MLFKIMQTVSIMPSFICIINHALESANMHLMYRYARFFAAIVLSVHHVSGPKWLPSGTVLYEQACQSQPCL